MRQRSATKRSAYTLLEVSLVCALLVVVGSVSFPTVLDMYGRQRIEAGTDSVRAAWALAKARAIEEGRPYRFSVVPGRGVFRLAPDLDSYWSGSAPGQDSQGQGLIKEGTLPAGVLFAGSDGATPSMGVSPAAGPTPVGQFTRVAVFLPDGTAREDIAITFHLNNTRPRVLRLRAMTGVVTVKPQGVR